MGAGHARRRVARVTSTQALYRVLHASDRALVELFAATPREARTVASRCGKASRRPVLLERFTPSLAWRPVGFWRSGRWRFGAAT